MWNIWDICKKDRYECLTVPCGLYQELVHCQEKSMITIYHYLTIKGRNTKIVINFTRINIGVNYPYGHWTL